MLLTLEGVYRNGKIELLEKPREVREGEPVVVTFLRTGTINLRNRGIDENQAASLRARLSAFVDDWESPEMDIYNDYDGSKAKLQSK